LPDNAALHEKTNSFCLEIAASWYNTFADRHFLYYGCKKQKEDFLRIFRIFSG